MKLLLTCLLALSLPQLLSAQSLDSYRWQARIVLIFTPSINDPLFTEQYGLLRAAAEELDERLIKIMLVAPDGDYENSGIFVQESSAEYYYDYFSVQPSLMELVLVGLDGTEKFRARNSITPASVLLELIDSMPLRQRELLEGTGNKSQINQTESVLPTETGSGY